MITCPKCGGVRFADNPLAPGCPACDRGALVAEKKKTLRLQSEVRHLTRVVAAAVALANTIDRDRVLFDRVKDQISALDNALEGLEAYKRKTAADSEEEE